MCWPGPARRLVTHHDNSWHPLFSDHCRAGSLLLVALPGIWESLWLVTTLKRTFFSAAAPVLSIQLPISSHQVRLPEILATNQSRSCRLTAQYKLLPLGAEGVNGDPAGHEQASI